MTLSLGSVKAFLHKHRLLVIFLACFIVFNLNLRRIGSGDTMPASLLPFGILENHNLFLDQFTATDSPYFNINDNSFLSRAGGHDLSIFPVVIPVLLTPLYVLPYLFLKVAGIPMNAYSGAFFLTESVMEKLCASAIASLSVVFVYLSLRKLFDDKAALLTTFVFALATNTWAISSQGLWQQGAVELLLSVMLFIVLSDREGHRAVNMLYLGVLSGLLALCRPPDAILLIPVWAYILGLKDIRSILAYGVSAAAAGLPFLLYNYYYFHSIFGWYKENLVIINVAGNYVANAFLAYLVSPNRGIFVFSPVLLFAIAGLYLVLRDKSRPADIRLMFATFPVCFLADLLIYSMYANWWGGWSYGYRYLTGSLPIFALCLGGFLSFFLAMKRSNAKTALGALLAIFLLWSVALQVIGVFYYPHNNWDASPDIDQYNDRVWAFPDTQYFRSLEAGPYDPFGSLNKAMQNKTS